MSEKLDPKETVSIEELVMSNVITLEAIVTLLDKKGLLKQSEILDEIKRLKQ
jgi:hypothetical protein